MLTYTWKQAFQEIDLSYGAALSFMVAAIVALISIVEFRFARQQEQA
jgi:ABC-type sugar transport system permease subunit